MIFSQMTIQEKIKYSGALEQYPFLEEILNLEVPSFKEVLEENKELRNEIEELGEILDRIRDCL